MTAKKRTKRVAPTSVRKKVQIGNTEVPEGAIRRLRYAWETRQLILFLGAGVSIPYGLPSWKNLVLELLFEQAQDTRRLGRMWPHYRRAVASWMTDYFDYDPLVLARMVERHLREVPTDASPHGGTASLFLERLRAHMYANLRKPHERTLLAAIADLVARGGSRSGVEAIVTFNFDDLLEHELERKRVKVQPVTSGARQDGSGLPVIHVHGFIPQSGPLLRDDIVFTEPDYHRLTESVFHWGLSEVVERLRKSTVLFVGLSMTDPSLRRLLDASRNSDIPPHWQIQKRHQVHQHDVPQVMTEVERRARLYAADLGRPDTEMKAMPELEDSIHAALRQADSYDREVFESMGVKTIWVERFEDIAAIIDAIPSAGGPRRSRPAR